MQLSHSFYEMDYLFYLGSGVGCDVVTVVFSLFYVIVNIVSKCVDAKFADLFVKAF
jgi:hypothetical protein